MEESLPRIKPSFFLTNLLQSTWRGPFPIRRDLIIFASNSEQNLLNPNLSQAGWSNPGYCTCFVWWFAMFTPHRLFTFSDYLFDKMVSWHHHHHHHHQQQQQQQNDIGSKNDDNKNKKTALVVVFVVVVCSRCCLLVAGCG